MQFLCWFKDNCIKALKDFPWKHVWLKRFRAGYVVSISMKSWCMSCACDTKFCNWVWNEITSFETLHVVKFMEFTVGTSLKFLFENIVFPFCLYAQSRPFFSASTCKFIPKCLERMSSSSSVTTEVVFRVTTRAWLFKTVVLVQVWKLGNAWKICRLSKSTGSPENLGLSI